jgi:GxxExxY protein
MRSIIEDACNSIYKQLGPAHNECVYQKALIIELYNMGAKSVEFEKHVPVFFKDSNGTTHTIGDERVDILATFPEGLWLIELKAIAKNRLQGYVEQVNKYKRSLAHMNVFPTQFVLINFPTNIDPQPVVEVLVVVSSTENET